MCRLFNGCILKKRTLVSVVSLIKGSPCGLEALCPWSTRVCGFLSYTVPLTPKGRKNNHPDPAQGLPSPWPQPLANSDVLLTPVLDKHMLRKEFQLYPHLASCAKTANGLHSCGAQMTSGAGAEGRCRKTEVRFSRW